MKKIRLFIAALAITAMAAFPAYAGQWKQEADGRWWYQNDNGSYPANQWQEINGKQYYFGADGYMLANTKTPDGYFVDESGAWIDEGETGTAENAEKTYDNKAELYITAYGGPGGIRKIDSPILTTVYYNNEYIGERGRTIKIVHVGVSKDGDADIQCTMSESTYMYGLKMKIKYTLEDNSHVELTDEITRVCDDITDVYSFGLAYPYGVIRKENSKPVSAVVYIDKGNIQ